MTRTLSLSLIVLLGLGAVAHAQSNSSSKCGPETWSTDKMAYVGVPCAGSETAAPQQASTSTDLQYCGALVARYDDYLNKDGRSGGMQSTNNAANVAASKCRAGDPSGIADLEHALKDGKVALPPRT